MEQVWSGFRIGQVIRADNRTMLSAGCRWLLTLVSAGRLVPPPVSLFDNRPLRALLADRVDFEAIAASVDDGHLRAVALSTTGYVSARSVTFFDGGQDVAEWQRTAHEGRRTRLTLPHLMASLAIPALFPPEWIGTEHFGDGAMRQTAPLAPAVHLGAERILVIGVRAARAESAPARTPRSPPPGIGELFGFMLDALFANQVMCDLERLETLNALAELAPGRGPRAIRALRIAPEADLGELAAERIGCLPGAMRALLGSLGVRRQEGGLLESYLMFESAYTQVLIELGYRDAMTRADELRAFLEAA
jgi:NTE family protein